MSIPTQAETLGLIAGNQFAELDQRFGAIQQAYKNNKITDEGLRAAFRVFYATDAALEPHYAAWVHEFPKSYVAHLARGIYYKRVGFERRGSNFIGETSPQQLAGMEAAFAVADQELTASFALDDKPLLSYLHAIDLRNATDDKSGTRKLLDLAVGIDPANFVVREKYMGTLQTRWGGSVDEMQSFLDECSSAGLSESHLKQLQAMVLEDQAWVHQYREGNFEAAVRDYRRAAELSPVTSECQECGPLDQAADLLLQEQKYGEAIELYSQVLASNPNSIHALYNRAYCNLHLNRANVSVPDLQRAAELNDVASQELLGRIYLTGTSVPRDRERAIVWLKRAADQNDEMAKQLLQIALDKNAMQLPEMRY